MQLLRLLGCFQWEPALFSDSACWRPCVQVDRLGRKALLIAGSIQGFLAEIAAAILLAVTYKGGQYIDQGPSVGMLVLICLFSISFGYGTTASLHLSMIHFFLWAAGDSALVNPFIAIRRACMTVIARIMNRNLSR